MPKDIYNEGRVVGYSAYETYVKHALSEDPNGPVANEREWLAAMLGYGSSMILKVPVNRRTGKASRYLDFKLPDNSRLLAANTIIGSLFIGECECDSTGWATKVIDYGQGISNTTSSHPSNSDNASNYPAKSITKYNETVKKQLLQYIKIQDGVILQPGQWKDTGTTPPKELIPNLVKQPTFRLVISSDITEPFYILLTGLTDNAAIIGTSYADGYESITAPEYVNGQFLGPTIFPWASKVIFTMPGSITYYLRENITTANNSLKLEHDEDIIETRFTASQLTTGLGVSINGPSTDSPSAADGSPITISSVINTSDDTATKNAQSSVRSSKYLKVAQTKSQTKDAATTTLTPSANITTDSFVAITQPSSAGSYCTINLSSAFWTWKNNVDTRLSNIETTLNASVTNLDNLIKAFQNLLTYIGGGSSSPTYTKGDTTIKVTGSGLNGNGKKIPTGNLNITSSSSAIKCHSSDQENDIKVK